MPRLRNTYKHHDSQVEGYATGNYEETALNTECSLPCHCYKNKPGTKEMSETLSTEVETALNPWLSLANIVDRIALAVFLILNLAAVVAIFHSW